MKIEPLTPNSILLTLETGRQLRLTDDGKNHLFVNNLYRTSKIAAGVAVGPMQEGLYNAVILTIFYMDDPEFFGATEL